MENFLFGLVVGCFLTIVLIHTAQWFAIMIPWQRAMMSGASVSVFQILRMRLKGCPVTFLVDAYVAFVHSGEEIDLGQVEACYLARKHEIREDDMGAFLKMLKEFARTGQSP